MTQLTQLIGRRASALTLLAAAAALGACTSRAPNAPSAPTAQGAAAPTPSAAASPLNAQAQLKAASGVAQPNPQSPVAGTVQFAQAGEVVSVKASVTGLKPNAAHGFHVHEKGDCSAPDLSSAGGHFNPTGQPHGAHGNGAHHLGDMPQLVADAQGRATLSFTSQSLKLNGPHSIVGKSVIVHRDPDDPSHQPVGNAGPRLACAVIEADKG